MLIIEGDTIVRVEEDLTPPTGARVWDMTGTTLYPGFIDPYVLTTTEERSLQVTRTLMRRGCHASCNWSVAFLWNDRG